MALASDYDARQAQRHPKRGLLTPAIEPLSHRLDHERGEPLFQRDPAYIGRRLSAVTRYVNFFSPEVRGLDNLPAEGPVLVVGNHSCLFYMPDVWVVALEIIRRRGLEQPAYALGYDLLFGVPLVGSFLRRIGAIPAGGPQAESALEHEARWCSSTRAVTAKRAARGPSATRSTSAGTSASCAWRCVPVCPSCPSSPRARTTPSSWCPGVTGPHGCWAWTGCGSRSSPSSWGRRWG